MPSSIMSPGTQRQQWSAERVIEAIQVRHRSRLPVNVQAVQSDDSRLVAAGRRLFGSWTAALVAAQVPMPPLAIPPRFSDTGSHYHSHPAPRAVGRSLT